jgi:hypothetical protein
MNRHLAKSRSELAVSAALRKCFARSASIRDHPCLLLRLAQHDGLLSKIFCIGFIGP